MKLIRIFHQSQSSQQKNGTIHPFHQNVLWTFLLGLLFITGIEKTRHKGKPLLTIIVFLPSAAAGYVLD